MNEMMYKVIGACAALIAALWVVYPVVMFTVFTYCVYVGTGVVAVYVAGYVGYTMCKWMVK